MLPSHLRGVYRQYKAETSTFLSWVAETAKKCGHKADTSRVPLQRHGNPSIAHITIESLRDMARTIVECGDSALQIPHRILVVGQRAIRRRRAFSKALKQLSIVQPDADADARHDHFVNKLEETLQELHHG